MNRRKYTAEQVEYFNMIVPGNSHAKIAEMFNERFPDIPMTVAQVKSTISNRGLRTGRSGYYKKGHEPFNKGKRMRDYVSVDAMSRMEKTMFKPGCPPVNHRQIGSVRINSEGYEYIKVAEPNVWIASHWFIWERANGPVPKNHVVVFADGDKQNITLDNLILVSRAQHAVMCRMGLYSSSADLTRSGLALADLTIAVSAKQGAYASQKERYARLKAAGMCVSCGQRPSVIKTNGKHAIYCETCRVRYKKDA